MQNTAQAFLPIEEPVEVKDDTLSGVQYDIAQMRLLRISNAVFEGFDLRDIAACTLHMPIRVTCELPYAEITFRVENHDPSDINRNRKADLNQYARLRDKLCSRISEVVKRLSPIELHFLYLNLHERDKGHSFVCVGNVYGDYSIWGHYASMLIDMVIDRPNFRSQRDIAGSFHESNVRLIVRELMTSNELRYPLGDAFQAAMEHSPELCRKIMKEETLVYCNRWRME